MGKLKCKQNAASSGYRFPIRFGRHKLWHLINWHSVIVRHLQFIVCVRTPWWPHPRLVTHLPAFFWQALCECGMQQLCVQPNMKKRPEQRPKCKIHPKLRLQLRFLHHCPLFLLLLCGGCCGRVAVHHSV